MFSIPSIVRRRPRDPSSRGPVGDVRITAPYTFGVTFIAPVLPAFLKAHPGLNVHMELTSRNVNLAEEGFDLAVRIGAPPPGLVAHRLAKNRIRLCASAAYCVQHGEPRTPADLARHPLLLIGSPRATAALRLTSGSSRSMVSARPRLMSSDPAVILQAVAAGSGIGQVPVILAQDALERGTLVSVLPEWSLPAADISLIYPRARVLAPRVRALVDYLRATIRLKRHHAFAAADRNDNATESPLPSSPGPRRTGLPRASARRRTMARPKPLP